MKSLSRICIPCLLIITASMIAGCNREKGEATQNSEWAIAVYSQMTEIQKTGQVLCFTIDPIRYFVDAAYKKDIKGLVNACAPGALHLSSDLTRYDEKILSEFDSVKLLAIVREIRNSIPIPPFVTADFENGAWFWDRRATRFPCPQAFGAIESPVMAYRQGKITAIEASAQGINMVFAPTINIASPNKTILENMACYSGDPSRASELVSHFVRGLQEAGVAACLKYFNPEGNDPDDPLRSGIAAEASAIMGLPFSPSDTTQSVQSKNILSGTYSFNGIVFRGISIPDASIDLPGTAAALMESFKEDQDMVILHDDIETIRLLTDYIFKQLQVNSLDASALDASVKKILQAKEKLGIHNLDKGEQLILSGVGVREYHQTAEEIVRSSITLLKNDRNAIPLRISGERIMFVNFIDKRSSADGVYFTERILKNYPQAKVMSILPDPDPRIIQEVLRRAGEADAIICALFMKPAPEEPTPRLPEEHLSLLRRLGGIHLPNVCISFYSPTYINSTPGFRAFLTTYFLSPESMQAAIDVIFGKAGVSGKLPFTISNLYPAGYGIILKESETAPQPANALRTESFAPGKL